MTNQEISGGSSNEKNNLTVKNDADKEFPSTNASIGDFEDDLLDDDEAVEAIPDDIAQLLNDTEQFQLTQDTKGFASCFPDWDLYPVRKK